MRIIGLLDNKERAERFSRFLTRQGIENHLEMILDPETKERKIHIWVSDEDRIGEASEWLSQFQKDSMNSFFDAPISIEDGERERQSFTPYLTIFFIVLSVGIYLTNFWQSMSGRHDSLSETTMVFTPIQKTLLFDVPPIVDKYEKFFQENPIRNEKDLSPDLLNKITAIGQTPYFRGIYDWILLKMKTGQAREAEGPIMEKIRHGEVWRLFTPAILHRDLLHILFNMIWLWALGKAVEERIGFGKTLLFTIIVGLFSNGVQYFLSGPFFLGYSGIVMGLAGFTWMREKIAPWEGYPLSKSTIRFLAFFVLTMLALQIASFVVTVFTKFPFELNIANGAHIAGAILGGLLGRSSFFAMRVK